MAISTFKRYEKKFLLGEAQYRAILPEIMKHMREDEFCKNGKEYGICNIYYDTEDSSVIRHSLSKPYYKEKLRLRSYGAIVSPNSKVFLELKKKIGGVVCKRRAVLKLNEAIQFIEHGIRPENLDYINTQVLNEIDFYLQNNPVKPASYISYDRTAMFGKEASDFRITFDRNIITRRDHLSLEYGRFGRELIEPGSYLMEIKVSNAFPIWLANLLSENHIYMSGFSKYGQEYNQNLQRESSDYRLQQAV